MKTEEVMTSEGGRVVSVRRYRTNPTMTIEPWSVGSSHDDLPPHQAFVASPEPAGGSAPPSGYTDFSQRPAPEAAGPTGPGSTEPPIVPRSEP
jgi:hypothetical protein